MPNRYISLHLTDTSSCFSYTYRQSYTFAVSWRGHALRVTPIQRTYKTARRTSARSPVCPPLPFSPAAVGSTDRPSRTHRRQAHPYSLAPWLGAHGAWSSNSQYCLPILRMDGLAHHIYDKVCRLGIGRIACRPCGTCRACMLAYSYTKKTLLSFATEVMVFAHPPQFISSR